MARFVKNTVWPSSEMLRLYYLFGCIYIDPDASDIIGWCFTVQMNNDPAYCRSNQRFFCFLVQVGYFGQNWIYFLIIFFHVYTNSCNSYTFYLIWMLIPNSLLKSRTEWMWRETSDLLLSRVARVTNQDEKLTVTQAAPGSGNPSSIRFRYQISERRSAFWDTALSGDSLFLEIPAGPLVEGSKDGWASFRMRLKIGR